MRRMTGKAVRRAHALPLLLVLSVASAFVSSEPVWSQTGKDADAMRDLERSFRIFLDTYQREIRARNADYLKAVHPKLPGEMYQFFFDVTLQMMRHSDETGLEPKIECQEFKVCRAIYTQANGSWASQRFILYEGAWRWIDG